MNYDNLNESMKNVQNTLNLFLIGIDDFLDHVTVLPPGEWDPKTRIEPPKSVPNKVR